MKATCRGLSEALGIKALVDFLTDADVQLFHYTDAEASLGILRRTGAGGLKHRTVKQLWTPQVFKRPGMHTLKLPRRENPADALCSMQNVQSLLEHMSRLRYVGLLH